jgi:hypothetical protein
MITLGGTSKAGESCDQTRRWSISRWAERPKRVNHATEQGDEAFSGRMGRLKMLQTHMSEKRCGV